MDAAHSLAWRDQTRRGKRARSAGDWLARTVAEYDKVVVIGTGTFGEVWKARERRTGRMVALKTIKADRDTNGFPITALREVKYLRELQHENVVQLLDVVVMNDNALGDDEAPPRDQRQARDKDKNKKKPPRVALVLEYLDHDLMGLLETPEAVRQMTPAHVRCFMSQILEGVAFMHSRGIMHRDLKGANVLVSSQGHLKIADWGLSRQTYAHQGHYTQKVITLWYRPPELLLKTTMYGPAVDIWSVGCIFAELLTKKALLCGKEDPEQLRLIFQLLGTPTPETWSGVVDLPEWSVWEHTVKAKPLPNTLQRRFADVKDPVAIDLISTMLVLDPAKRVTAKQALEHRYLQVDRKLLDPTSLPKLTVNSCHEFEAKQRKVELEVRQRRAEMDKRKAAQASSAGLKEQNGHRPGEHRGLYQYQQQELDHHRQLQHQHQQQHQQQQPRLPQQQVQPPPLQQQVQPPLLQQQQLQPPPAQQQLQQHLQQHLQQRQQQQQQQQHQALQHMLQMRLAEGRGPQAPS